MFKSKKFKILFTLTAVISVALTAYIFSFEDIEPVCGKRAGREVYLLNYTSKNGLQEKVYAHNKDVNFTGSKFRKVYILHSILKIPDPVFDDEYDYRKGEGCNNIDNMDIYCLVDFTKGKNGKIEASYNFYE